MVLGAAQLKLYPLPHMAPDSGVLQKIDLSDEGGTRAAGRFPSGFGALSSRSEIFGSEPQETTSLKVGPLFTLKGSL